MRQVYASRKWRRKTEWRITLSWSAEAFFPPSSLQTALPRALRVEISSRNTLNHNPGLEDEVMRSKHSASSLQTTAHFSVFLHNSIIRFFMLTHHVAKTWSFLKGHWRAVHMSPSLAAAPLWLTDGFHLVNVFKPCSFYTCINPGSSGEWGSWALNEGSVVLSSGSWPEPALTCECMVPPGALMRSSLLSLMWLSVFISYNFILCRLVEPGILTLWASFVQ